MDWELSMGFVLKMWILTVSVLVLVEFTGVDEIILGEYMG